MDFSSLVAFAVARLHISISEVLELTPREFGEAIETVNKVEEQQIKAIYESSRLQTMYLLNIHLKPQHQLRKPQDLYTFSWEEERKTKITDWKEMKALFKAIAKNK